MELEGDFRVIWRVSSESLKMAGGWLVVDG